MSYSPRINDIIQASDINLSGTNLSSAILSAEGSRKVGDYGDYINFTPDFASVKGALYGIDTAFAGKIDTSFANVSGTLGITHGGTGQVTPIAAFAALSPMAFKGDLISRDAFNPVRVPVGTDGQFLIADSSQTSGLRWLTFSPSGGTVTSVAASVPSYMNVTGSPITTSGTLVFTFNSQTANKFFASPNGSPGAPDFRLIVSADIPTLNQNTTGTSSNVTGIIAIANGGTGQSTANSAFAALSPMTTAGDMIYMDGTPVPARLTVGIDGTILTVVGGFPTWMPAPPAAFNKKEYFTLSGTDITNQYIDLSFVARTDSIDFLVKGGGIQIEGVSDDYSVDYTGGAGGNTRITFLNDLATGGVSELLAGDIVVVKYQY